MEKSPKFSNKKKNRPKCHKCSLGETTPVKFVTVTGEAPFGTAFKHTECEAQEY